MTPKSEASANGTSTQATVHSAPLVDVIGQQVRVIHLVDMVAGQDDEVSRPGSLQNIEVLIDRVGGAAVPGRLVEPLLRRQQVEELAHFRAQKRPAHLQMAQQAVRLVLGQDPDPPDPRIEAVRQGEIDDAELAAEKHRGLGAPVGQLLQPAAAAAGEDQRQRLAGQPLLDARARQHVALPGLGRVARGGLDDSARTLNGR